MPELVEVEVETLPDEPPEPPDDVLVEPPDVEVEPPEVEDEPPEVEVEPPEVEVEPVLVEVMTTEPPPPPLPPPKNPPPKPPPKPPPHPPPITTGVLPPDELTGCGGSGGSIGIAAIAICGAGSHVVVLEITRRARFTWRGALAIWRFALTGALATFACFTYCGLLVFGFSATCTAPPPRSAPPAATVASFAMAVRTDIDFSSHNAGV